MERIKIHNASKEVGDKKFSKPLWTGLDMHVDAGETLCITGKSGSGKSTLLNCLGLVDTFSSGTYSLNGHNVTDSHWRTRMKHRRYSIGYLFQDYALIENESVKKNIELARNTNEHLSTSEALEQVGMGGREDETVFQLSGGEQQRVAMARLLVRNPPIVLADEPTASLDRKNAAVILDHLKHLAEQGAAVVIVSHDPWVSEQCSRIMELVPHE